MSALSIQVPFPVFQDRDGQPLDNGYVWIGEPNLNPQTNPVVAYFDAALTVVAAQPLRTINGYISNAGTPAQVYVDGVSFSILVQDSKGTMVYNFPDGSGISPDASGVGFTGFKGQIGFVQDLADDDGSDWVGFQPAGSGAVARSVQDKMRDTVSVKDFGAVADGVDTGSAFTGTDNTAAFQAALDACGLLGKTLYIPGGKYRFAPISTANTHILTLNYLSYDIYGSGELLVDDDLGNTSSFKSFIGTANIGASLSRTLRNSFKMRDVTLRGRWSHSPAATGGTHGIYLENFSEIVLDNISVFDIRGKFSISKYNNNVRVLNSRFERVASDCIRFPDAQHVLISGNVFKWVDDDVIALPAPDTVTAAERTNATITGNTFEQCESILVLGAKNVTVTNNTMKFSKSSAIYIGGQVGTEGSTATESLVVANNTIIDPIMRYDSPSIATQADGNAAITVSGIGMSQVTTSGYPGLPTSAGTSFVHPVDTLDTANAFLMYNYDASVKSIPPGYNYIVANNTVMRTLPPVAAFSQWGQGLMFSATSGWVDPAVLITNFVKHALMVNSDARNVVFTGNAVSGFPNGAGIYLQVIAGSPDKNYAFDNILVSSNTITDCKYGVSNNQASSATPVQYSWDIKVNGNIFDCDTYHTSSARTSPLNGTWQAGIAITACPIGVMYRSTKGWQITNNTIANALYAELGNGANFQQNAVVKNNILKCTPAAVNFSTSNKGIGDIGTGGDKYIHQVVECDPRTPNAKTVSLTRSGLIVTATSVGHGFTVGQAIIITGANEAGYLGQWLIATVPDANTFTFSITSTPTTPATGTITATRTPYGANIFAPLNEAAAAPTVGTYVTGHVIKNTNPVTASSKTTLGWVRQSVGSTHTVATTATADWAPIVATTS